MTEPSIYRKVPGHCRRGLHEMTEDNTATHPKGWKVCKACRTAGRQRDHENHKDRRLSYRREWGKQNRECEADHHKASYQRIREAIDAAKAGKPCADCGGTFAPCAMDFDHVRGEKKFNVGLAKTLAQLAEEIAKCELVCANCHRVRTFMRKQRRPVRSHKKDNDMTKPTIHDLFNPGSLQAAVADGYVRRQEHPTEPLAVLNYTERCQYERYWTDVTRQCRGLIYRTDTLEVVARPFPKFHNVSEHSDETLARYVGEPVEVWDKLDGSLGILYPTSDGWAVATRGSFTSDQAIHATALLRDRYAGYAPPPGVTVLAEVIYPTNRIVVDYADLDDLVLLAGIEIATGRTAPYEKVAADWPGPVAERFPYSTLAAALAAPERPGREGYVIRFTGSDFRVKSKAAEYVRLHAIVTGLTARTVWQHIVDGKPLADLIAPLPDEFHLWVRGVAAALDSGVRDEQDRLTAAFRALYDTMPDDWAPATREGRRDFAARAAGSSDSWAMFALLDQRDIRPELVKRAKPDPYLTPSGRTYTEDNA